jgi:hypothetical protein
MTSRPLGSSDALRRLERRLQGLARVTPAQVGRLLNTWKTIVAEDNRAGVLAGLDKDGKPAPPVKPRQGRGSGPRLAPHGAASQVISKFTVTTDPSRRTLTASWSGVRSKQGRPFLHHHFNGDGHNRRFDLRGVRPQGRSRMASAMAAWIRNLWRAS